MERKETTDIVKKPLDWSKSTLIKIIRNELNSLSIWPFQEGIRRTNEFHDVPTNIDDMMALAGAVVREIKLRGFGCRPAISRGIHHVEISFFRNCEGIEYILSLIGRKNQFEIELEYNELEYE